MNTMEITNVATQTEDVESMAVEFNAPQTSEPRSRRDGPVRYALLIVIALLAGWLAYSILSSIHEINAQMEMIQTHILAWH